MPDAPDRAELEAAIYRHLGLQPARETTEAVIVKVAELEPVAWRRIRSNSEPDCFFPSRFLEATAQGFKRDEILPGWQVKLSDEKVYSHRDDDAGAVLLTLPVVLTLTPA